MLKIGTQVTARCRNRKITAVVAGVHWLKRKGKTRRLAQQVTGDPGSLDRDLVVLVSMTENIHYRVEESSCKPTGKTTTAHEALARLAEVKQIIASSNANRAHNQRMRNFDHEEASGLDNVSIGDTIEVELKSRYGNNHWKQVIFKGIVTSSGNVRFLDPDDFRGRKRTCSAKYARPLKS